MTTRHLISALVAAIFTVWTGISAPCDTPAAPVFSNIQHDPLFNQRTYQMLRDITVYGSWNQVPLSRALIDLTLMVRKTYPIHSDISFRFTSDASAADRQRKVSLKMNGMPVYEVLENLSRQADFDIRVHEHMVLIEPRPMNSP